MKFVVVLYILAACFLTAAVTHSLTRSALQKRNDETTREIVKSLDPTQDQARIKEIQLTSLKFRMKTGMPCELAFAMASPFLTCLYGAVTSHRAIALGKPFSVRKKLAEMLGVFGVTFLFTALAIPC